jgi:hypothetical protein
MAAFRISAERSSTRASEIRQVGKPAGIPDLLAGREMPSLIGGGANRLHCIEGSRPEEPALGSRPMSKVIINALVYPVSTRAAFWILVVEEHAARKSW